MLEIKSDKKVTNYADEQKARGSGLLASRRELNTKNFYDKMYNDFKVKNNKYLDDDFWSTAAIKGELDQLVYSLSNNETNQYLDELQTYGNQVDYDTYMLALNLPTLDNEVKKPRLSGDGQYNYGDMTDREWGEMILKATTDRFDAELIEMNKDDKDWWEKAGAWVGSLAGHVVAGTMNALQNTYNLGEGIFNILTGEDFLEAFADDSDETLYQAMQHVKYATFELERNTLPIVNAVEAYEQGYLPPTASRDASFAAAAKAIEQSAIGTGYNTWGRWWSSGLQSFGEMLPFMLLPTGSLSTAAAKAVKSTSFYMSNVFSGGISDTVKTAALNGISYKDLNGGEVVFNAGLKAGAQYLMEILTGKILGFTGLDQMLGVGEAAQGASKWFINAAGATGAKAAGIALGRGALSMFKEGLEEVTQDLSDNLIDFIFGGTYRDRALDNLTWQNIGDAFVVGALTSGVIGTLSSASVIINRNNRAVGISEAGAAYKMGFFQQLNYNQAMQAMASWEATLRDVKATTQEKADAAFRLNSVAATLGNVLKTFGTERAQKALQLLNAYQNKQSTKEQKDAAKKELSDPKFAEQILSEFVLGETAAKLKLADDLKKKIKKGLEDNAKKLKDNGTTKITDIVTEVSENVNIPEQSVKAVKSLLKQTGAEALVAVDGAGVVSSKDVIFAEESLIRNGKVSEILQGLAYDKALKAIAPELNKKQSDLILSEYSRLTNRNDATIEDALIALLFDKSFYTYVLLRSTETQSVNDSNEAIKLLATIDKIVKGKIAADVDKGTLTQAAYQKLVERIQENMRAGLLVFATNYANIDLDNISPEILPAELKNVIRNHINVRFTKAIDDVLEDKRKGRLDEQRIKEFNDTIDKFKGNNVRVNEYIDEAKQKILSTEYNDRFDAEGVVRFLAHNDSTIQLTYLPSSGLNIVQNQKAIILVTEFFDADWNSLVQGKVSLIDMPDEARDYITTAGYDLNNYNDRIAMLRDRMYAISKGTLTVSYNGEVLEVLDKNKLVKKEYLGKNGDSNLLKDIKNGTVKKLKDICKVTIDKRIGNLKLVLNNTLDANGQFNDNQPNRITLKGTNLVNTIMHETTHATQYFTRPEQVTTMSAGAHFAHLEKLNKRVQNKIETYIAENFPLTYSLMMHSQSNNLPAILYFNIDGEMQAMCKFTSLLFETGFTWNADKTVLYSPDGKTSWNLTLKTNKRQDTETNKHQDTETKTIITKYEYDQLSDEEKKQYREKTITKKVANTDTEYVNPLGYVITKAEYDKLDNELKSRWRPKNIIANTTSSQTVYEKITDNISESRDIGLSDKIKEYIVTDNKTIIDDVNSNIAYKGLKHKYNEDEKFDNTKGDKKRIVPGAVWFTDNKNVAETYADLKEGEVAERYLSVNNPLVIDAGGRTFDNAVPGVMTDTIVKDAKAAGYDSVIFENIIDVGSRILNASDLKNSRKPSRDIVVFSNNQIKSKGVNENGKQRNLHEVNNRGVSESTNEQTSRMAQKSKRVEETTNLDQRLEKLEGYQITKVGNVQVNIKNEVDKTIISKYKKKYNVDVKLYKGDIIVDGIRLNEPGFTDGNTIYLSEDYTEYADSIVEHEYFHVRAINDPKAYSDLVTAFKTLCREDILDDLLTEYRKYYPTLTQDERIEEILANIVAGVINVEFKNDKAFNTALKKLFKNKSVPNIKSTPQDKVAFYISPDEKLMASTGFESIAGLLNQLERGYLPAPSIAVNATLTNADYGSMFLVYNTEAVEQAIKQNRVYKRDAWTGRRAKLASRFTREGGLAIVQKILDNVLDTNLFGEEFTKLFNKTFEDAKHELENNIWAQHSDVKFDKYADAVRVTNIIIEDAITNINKIMLNTVSELKSFPTEIANSLGNMYNALLLQGLLKHLDRNVERLGASGNYNIVNAEAIKLLRRGADIKALAKKYENGLMDGRAVTKLAVFDKLLNDPAPIVSAKISKSVFTAVDSQMSNLEQFFNEWSEDEENVGNNVWSSRLYDKLFDITDTEVRAFLTDEVLRSLTKDLGMLMYQNHLIAGLKFIKENMLLDEYKYKLLENDRDYNKFDDLVSEEEIENLQAKYTADKSGASAYHKVANNMDRIYNWESDLLNQSNKFEEISGISEVVSDIIIETIPTLHSIEEVKEHSKYLNASDLEKRAGEKIFDKYEQTTFKVLQLINKLGDFKTLGQVRDVVVNILKTTSKAEVDKILSQFENKPVYIDMTRYTFDDIKEEVNELLYLRDESQKVPPYIEMKPYNLPARSIEYIVVPEADVELLKTLGIDTYLKQYDIELKTIKTKAEDAFKELPDFKKGKIKFISKDSLDTSKISDSRKISNKIAQASNLKYFIKPGQPIQLDERIQNFVIRTTDDFDKLEPVIRKAIKAGTLSLQDIRYYVATATSINDYTFQMIAKHIYDNDDVAKLTYKDMIKVLDNLEEIDIVNLFAKKSPVLNQKTTPDKMLKAYRDIEDKAKTNNKIKEKLGGYATLAGTIKPAGARAFIPYEADPDQLHDAFFRHYNGTIKSVAGLNNLGKNLAHNQEALTLMSNEGKGANLKSRKTTTWNWIDRMRKADINYGDVEQLTDTLSDVDRQDKINIIQEHIIQSIIQESTKLHRSQEEVLAEFTAQRDRLDTLSDEEINQLYMVAIGEGPVEATAKYLDIKTELEKRYTRKESKPYTGKYASRITANATAKAVGRRIAQRLAGMKVRYNMLSPELQAMFDRKGDGHYELNTTYQNMTAEELDAIIPQMQEAAKLLSERIRIVQAAKQSKIKAIERANRQAERMLDRPDTNKRTMREKIDVVHKVVIKNSTFTPISRESAPDIIKSVLATGWDKSRMSQVQELNNNIDQNVANADTFFASNPELLNMSTTEAEQAAKWFIGATITEDTSPQDRKKFEAIELYFLGYVLSEAREGGRFADLNANVKTQIENRLRDKATIAGTALSVWNNVRQRLNPVETMLSQSVVISGVELTDVEQQELLDAAIKGDMETVAKMQERILSRIKKEQKGKKGTLRRITGARSMSMLSSPLTWLRNLVSNFMLKRLNKWSANIGQNLFKGITKEGQQTFTGQITPEIQDFINKNFIDNKLFDVLVSNLAKYNPSDISKRFKNADGTIDKNAIISQMVIKSMYGKYYSENMFKSDLMNGTYQWLMKMMSDNNYVREAAIRYFGKIIAEKSYDLSKGVTDSIMTDFANAIGIAMSDYMHSDNFFNTLESIAAEHSEVTLFIYKNLMPFMGTSWNWFKAAIRFSPIGLAQSIIKLTRLENEVRKQEARWSAGKSQVAPEYTEYLIRRDLGSGIIGTAAFMVGILLAALGWIDLEDDDYGIPKLVIGNVKVDVSSIFGTSSVLAGAALIVDMKDQGLSWDTVLSGLDKTLDVTLDGFFLTELMSLDMYSGGGSFATALDLVESTLLSFIPNGLAWVAGMTYTGTLRKKGLLGKAAAKVPFLAGFVNEKKIDPFTGKDGGIKDIINRTLPYFDIKMTSRAKATANSLGLNKLELKGQYKINDEEFNLSNKDVTIINKQYGEWNAKDLVEFLDDTTYYEVKDDTTNTYKRLTYSQMTDKQRKNTINNIMTKNAENAKILAWLNAGYSYYASSAKFNELKKLGISGKLFIGNKGFVKK